MPNPYYDGPLATLLCGDCIEVLAAMEADSVDAIVTDPPYGLSANPDTAEVLRAWLGDEAYEHSGGGFMGKKWDSFVPGPRYWRAIARVLKPGGHLLVFSSTRTHDLMGIALRLAGLELRDTIVWHYGSGFPKSLNVSKAIDKMVGAEREVVGYNPYYSDGRIADPGEYRQGGKNSSATITAPATDAAKKWDGWGTGLKPASELILLFRKPLSERTIALNVLEHGTGALNVDGCRVVFHDGKTPEEEHHIYDGKGPRAIGSKHNWTGQRKEGYQSSPQGRWPPNLVFTHDARCRKVGSKRVRGGDPDRFAKTDGGDFVARFNLPPKSNLADADGLETIDAWECVEGCPVLELGRQSGERPSMSGAPFRRNVGHQYNGGFSGGQDVQGFYGDKGTAARFFPQFAWEEADFWCFLCGLPLGSKHGIMNENKGKAIPCDNASSVANPLSQNQESSVSVPGAALQKLPLESEGKSEKLNISVPIAEEHSRISQAITEGIVQQNADMKLDEKNVQLVKSAGSLCDSCATAIVQSLARIKQGQDLASIRGLDSMVGSRRNILVRSLVLFAESQAHTDTILTMASLTLLFGYVRDAINMSTILARNDQSLKSDLIPYLYQAKASRSERERGLEGLPETYRGSMGQFKENPGRTVQKGGGTATRNVHATVKPLALMRWLITLITPPGGVVLDPFAGSGSTLVAAKELGFQSIGIELNNTDDEPYCEIAKRRIMAVQAGLL